MLEVVDFIQKYWGIILAIIGLFATAFWLKADSKYAKKADLFTLSEVVKHNDHRVTQLETRVENLPTAHDFARLQVLATEIKGETKATTAELKALGHQVGLLLEAKVLGKE